MVQSVRSHPDSPHFEIRVWFDNDDQHSLGNQDELRPFNVNIHVGQRLNGYASTCTFCTYMADASHCPWITIADDDNVLEGKSFITDLKSQPDTGVYCTPEIYQLNRSSYREFYQYGIVPNGAWKVESPFIQHPTDAWMYDILVTKRKWRVHRFPGVTMRHNWRGICDWRD